MSWMFAYIVLDVRASVIIPSHNDDTTLTHVLCALTAQVDRYTEVIVVLDDYQVATDRIESLLAGVEHRIVDPRRALGRSRARNLGLQVARGTIVIFLDDDRIPGAHFLQHHLLMHRKQRCVVVGNRKNVFPARADRPEAGATSNAELMRKAKREGSDLVRRVFLVPSYNPLRWAGFVTGNASVRRHDLLETGGFDETFVGWGYEDSELGFRLAAKHIPFVKTNNAVNYHLEHPHKVALIRREERYNYAIFRKKILNYPLSAFLLTVIHLRFRIFFMLKHRY